MFRRKPAPITTASTSAAPSPTPTPTRADAASDSETSPSTSPSKKSGIKKLLGFGRKRKPATSAAAPTSAPPAPATTDSPASALAPNDDDHEDNDDGAQSANTTTDATSPLTSATDRSDSESERPSSAPSSSRGFHHPIHDPPPPPDQLDLITAPDLSPAPLIRPPTKRSKAALAQCFLDHVPVAELLVVVDRKRSSVNRLDSEHHLAPIHYAAIFATVDEFCAFVEAAGSDLDVNVVDGTMKRTAMMYLTMAHRDDLVEVVLEQFPQADVDAVDAFGYTCLHYAIATDDLAVLDLIMTRTPNLALLHNGDTFLHFALRLGHIDAALTVLPLLPPHLIDAREPGMDRTALHLACEMQIADVVHALVDAGADPMQVDRAGKLPLDYLSDDDELKEYLGAKTLEKEARQVVGKKAGFAGTDEEDVKRPVVPTGDVEQAEVLDESVGGGSKGAAAGFQYGNLMDDVSVSTNSGSSKHKSTASSHPSNKSVSSASSGDIDALLGELGLSSHHHQKDDPASEATTNPPTLSSPAAPPAAPPTAAVPLARTGMDVGRFLPALQAARETPVPPASSTDGPDHASDPAEDTSISISDPASEDLPLPLSDNGVSESSSPGILSPSPPALEPKSPAPIELFLAPRPGPRTIEPWNVEGRPRALTPLAPLAPPAGTSSALAAVTREPVVSAGVGLAAAAPASEIPQRARGMTLDGLDVAGTTTMTASDETSFDLDGMLRSVEELDENGADESVRVDSPSSLGVKEAVVGVELDKGAAPAASTQQNKDVVPVAGAKPVVAAATSAPSASTSSPAATSPRAASTTVPPSSTAPPANDNPPSPDTTSIGSLLPSDTGAPIPPLPAPITTAPAPAPEPASPDGSILEEDFDSCSVDESHDHGSDLPLPSDAADHDPPSTTSSTGGSWLQRLAPRLFARSNSTTAVTAPATATVDVAAEGADTVPVPVPTSVIDQPAVDAAKVSTGEPATPAVSPPAPGRVPALLSYVLGASVELAEPDVNEPTTVRAASLTPAGPEPAVEWAASPASVVPEPAAERAASPAPAAFEPAVVHAASPAPTSDIAESIASSRVSFSHPEITSRVTWDVSTSLSTSSMAESEGEVVGEEMDEDSETGSVVIRDGDEDQPPRGRDAVAPITAAVAVALSTIPSPRVGPLSVNWERAPRADLDAVTLPETVLKANAQAPAITMPAPQPRNDEPAEEESMTGGDSEYSFDFPTSDDEHAASPGIDYIPPPPATTPPPSPPRREQPAAVLSLPPSPLPDSVSPVGDLLPFPRAGPVRSTSLSALVVESGESRGHSPFSLGLSPVVTATDGVSPPPGAFASRLDVETPLAPAPAVSGPAGGYLQLYASPSAAPSHAAPPPAIITSLSPTRAIPAVDSADPTTPRGRDLAPTSPNLSRSPSPASLSKLRYDLEEVNARLDAERAKSKRQAEDLDRASARLRDKNAQCGELETKVERLRSDLEHQARRHAQAVADLEAQLADAVSARKRVEADRDRALADARAETETVREALRQANARLAAAGSAADARAASPAPGVAEEQAAATALDVALLTQKLDSAATHAGALRKQLELVQAQAAARTAEIESEAMGAKRELEHAQFQVKTLTVQAATARDQEREWRDRARNAETDAKDAREAVKAAEKVAADRADALARTTAELDRVSADLAAVRQRADAGAKAHVQVQAAQQELLNAQVQITRLRADLTTVNERADGASRDYQRVTKVKAQLEDEVQDLELKVSKLTKANELLTAEVQEAHAREIRSATSPTPAAISLRSERDALVAENQELQVGLDEVEAQLVVSRKDASSVRSELVQVQADLDLARADTKRAQAAADDRQKQLLDVQQQVEALKAQELHSTATVHRLEAKCAALQRTIDDRSAELESVRRDLATAQDQLRQARRDADERSRDVDVVQDQVKRAEMAQAAVRASLEDQIERNEQLAAECERLESLQQSLKKTADLYHLKIEQLTADKQREEALAATRQADHQVALESVQRALDTARSKLADRDKAIVEVKEEVERLTTALETKERDLVKAQRAAKDAQARETTAHDELAASEQQLTKLQARLDQTKAALQEQEQNFATAEQASADLAREVADAHRSLERVTAERDVAKKSVAQLQVQVRDHDLQRQSLAEEIARLKRQVKDLEGHVAQAHESAAEARRDLDLARAAAQAARASASSRSASSQSPTPAESQAAAELAATLAAEAHQRAARLAAQVETLQARLAAAETASHDAEAREVALREVAHRLRMQLTDAQDHGLEMHARALDKARALVAEAQADGLAGLQAKLAAQVRDAMDKATHAAVEEQQKQQQPDNYHDHDRDRDRDRTSRASQQEVTDKIAYLEEKLRLLTEPTAPRRFRDEQTARPRATRAVVPAWEPAPVVVPQPPPLARSKTTGANSTIHDTIARLKEQNEVLDARIKAIARKSDRRGGMARY
ncbi:hypothetical protein GGF32_002534 [Allomyces javanicus]|nr:hypothetical protein GGF32_002534 [Allomyces javanicus]